MSDLNETSGLSSCRQITDATSMAIFSPDNTSSDIVGVRIILPLPKRENHKEVENTNKHHYPLSP